MIDPSENLDQVMPLESNPGMSSHSNVQRQSSTYADEVNILLLGETGVGKSTFINAFGNFLTYDSMDEAKNDEIVSLIPCSFTITDENYEERKVGIGDDPNEKLKAGQSATQQCKCFVFPYGNDRLIRLIDTPGVGDTRGIEQDRLNFDNILAFISQFKELHCICILLKPNNARITVTFEFCIKQLLSHLQKSASRNIVFLFTNARGTFYRPGDTAPSLREILTEIKESPPYVEIPFKKDTIYCLDNESFRFLVALKNNITFDDHEVENFARSWDTSVKECKRLMDYILGNNNQKRLVPHKVQDTLSVNEARRMILNLTQPLADIAANIEDNLKVMDNQRKTIEANRSNIEVLKTQLNIKYLDVEYEDLSQPRTVCAMPQHCESVNVLGLTKLRYIRKCHDPCHLSNIPKETIGDPGLLYCAAFYPSNNCKQCGCSYQKHLHIYYETNLIEKERIDDNVDSEIKTKEDAQNKAQKMLAEIEQNSKEYELEKQTITKCTAKFAVFLKNNAIAPYNDSFKAYLLQLIENEQSLSKRGANNMEILQGLKNSLAKYEQEKNILDIAIQNSDGESIVNIDDIFATINILYNLKHYGKKIKESQDRLQSAKASVVGFGTMEIRFKPKKVSKNMFGYAESAINYIANKWR